MKYRLFTPKFLRLFLIGTLMVVLASACGFKLRGQITLSETLQAIALQGTAEHTELGMSIRNALSRAGGKLVAVDAANSVLVITEEKNTRQVLSVDSLGQANAYTLKYRLGFRLETPAAKILIKAQHINQQRQYRFDANNVLAKGDEELRIIRGMREDATSRMLVRLQAQLDNQNVSENSPATIPEKNKL